MIKIHKRWVNEIRSAKLASLVLAQRHYKDGYSRNVTSKRHLFNGFLIYIYD